LSGALSLSVSANWVERWLEHLRTVRNLKKSTLTHYERWARQADAAVCGVWTEAGIEEWLRAFALRGRAASTLRQVLAALKSAGEYQVIAGLLDRNPVARVKGPRIYAPRRPTLTVGEVIRLCFGGDRGRVTLPADPLGARNRTILVLLYVAALRVGDIHRLQIGDVDQDEDGVWWLLLRGSKWATQDHRVPIVDPPAARILASYFEQVRPELPEGRALFPGRDGEVGLSAWSVWDIWRRELEASGVEARRRRLSPHVLRHSLAHHVLEQGVDVPTLQAMLRHRDVRSTMVYLAADERKVAETWRRRSPFKPRAAARASLLDVAKGLLPR